MIAFVKQDGTIESGCYGDSPESLNGITKIPDGCTAVYIDDTQYPDVWGNMSEWQFVNGVLTNVPIPDSVKLANAQQAKINQLEQDLATTLTSGFTAKTLVGGATTPHTYPTDANAQSNFSGLINAFVTNPNKTSAMVLTLDAGWISHTKDEFYGIFNDGDAWKENQYAHLTDLVNQVNAVTTSTTNFLQAVQAIVWTAATY